MYKVKSIDLGNNTYYCGYISKYEQTEAEKEERRYMILQKLIGVSLIILSALSLLMAKVVPDIGIATIFLAFLGLILLLSNKRAFGQGGYNG